MRDERLKRDWVKTIFLVVWFLFISLHSEMMWGWFHLLALSVNAFSSLFCWSQQFMLTRPLMLSVCKKQHKTHQSCVSRALLFQFMHNSLLVKKKMLDFNKYLPHIQHNLLKQLPRKIILTIYKCILLGSFFLQLCASINYNIMEKSQFIRSTVISSQSL